jgi:hypothetical protein
MTLDKALQEIADHLGGTKASDGDIRLLREKLPAALVPEWLADMLKRYDLAGADFELTEEQDLSQLGASISWMPATEMIVEANECEPGMTVVRAGFLPFGTCTVGSGDPYFLDMRQGSRDPPVVRVPHDYAGGKAYPLDCIELVAPSLSRFLTTAAIG